MKAELQEHQRNQSFSGGGNSSLTYLLTETRHHLALPFETHFKITLTKPRTEIFMLIDVNGLII